MYEVSVSVPVSYLDTTARKVSVSYLDTKSGEVCVSYLDTFKKYLWTPLKSPCVSLLGQRIRSVWKIFKFYVSVLVSE